VFSAATEDKVAFGPVISGFMPTIAEKRARALPRLLFQYMAPVVVLRALY
jgi:hypothetical protein